MSNSSTSFTRRALLIGVDFYPPEYCGEYALLKGCVNDVRGMKSQLQKLSPCVDIDILTASPTTDGKSATADGGNLPTRANVVSSLKKMTAESSGGDFVYIHFSGHGTVMGPYNQYSNGSTGDLALALLGGTNGTMVEELRGEELAELLHCMVEKKLSVTVVLDCCFAGSVMRNDDSVRFLPYNSANKSVFSIGDKHESTLSGQTINHGYRGASMNLNWLMNPEGYTIYAACGPTQKAHEINAGGLKYGALSFFLIRIFTRYGRVGGKHQHIYSHLCSRFRESWPQQVSMIYGNRNGGFFEDTYYALDSVRIPIIRSSDGVLRLAAGEAHGVCNGDLFALCDVSESNDDPTAVVVKNANSLISELEFVEPTSLTALPLIRQSLRQFCIRLDLRVQKKGIWVTAIHSQKSLNVQFIEDVSIAATFAFYVTVKSKDVYEILDKSQKVIANMPPPASDLEENPSYLLEIMHHLVMFEMVKGLANSSVEVSSQKFRNSFVIQVVDAAGKKFHPSCSNKGCSHPGCLIEVMDGDTLKLIVQNEEKKGGPSLFVHVYNLGFDWDIENMLRADYQEVPPRSSNMNRNFVTGTDGEWKKSIKMTVQQDMKDKGLEKCYDTFKVFVTSQPTSFNLLELQEIGREGREHKVSRGTEQDSFQPGDWVALNFNICTYVNKPS